ncbi:MAG: porin [Aeromonas sp.]
MFKKSVLAAVVATAFALPAHADIKNLDIYGQIAISAWSGANWATENDDGTGYDNAIQIENESRIGFRGSKELANGPKFIWQIEGGNVADAGEGSTFGARDTFGGFEWEGIGKVRAGRMLTPLYELVDWPYSSITAGQVFDWAGDVIGGGNYDRQSNMIRFDSVPMNGFSYNAAIGRGNESDEDSNFVGLGAHYTTGGLTLHAAYERSTDRKISAGEFANGPSFGSLVTEVKDDDGTLTGYAASDDPKLAPHGTSDADAFLLAFEMNFDHGWGLYGAYKRLESNYDGIFMARGFDVATLDKMTQDSYSLGAIYNTGLWQFKLAYAANLAPKFETSLGKESVSDYKDSIISGQALYFLDDSAVAYARPYYLQRQGLNQVQDGDKEFGMGVGVEYYF